ncbi:MAG TPA: ABC transporter permease [Gemmatimonadaceae bacterium]|jgi:predicted permease
MMLVRDIQWSARSLGRTRGVAIAVTLTLALSVGATTVMFSIVNGILIDPLPFGNSSRLVWTVNRGTRPYDAMSPPDMKDWAQLVPSFEALGSWAPSSETLDDGVAPVHVDIAEVTDNWFTVLGVRQQLGRGFVAGEANPGDPKVVVLGDGLWRTNFGGDEHVIGRAIRLNGTSYTVVGIAPAAFDFPDHVEIWRPIAILPSVASNRGARIFRGPVALLKHNASFQQAQREARLAAAQLRNSYPDPEAGLSFDIETLHDHMVGNTRAPLIILLGAVGALLLIACVNIATLLLVRASARGTETGVRLALGAGRGRIVSQHLVESLLLAVIGGTLGALCAYAGVHALVNANVGELPLLSNVRVDGRVLGFALLVTIASGVLFGLAPAYRAARTDVADALRPGARGTSATRSANRMRQALVAAQLGLVLPLLIGATLLGVSFSRLVASDPGFRVDGLLRFAVDLPQCGTAWRPDSTCVVVGGRQYNRPEQIRGFTHEMLARLGALPSVQSASAGAGAPFTAWGKNQGILKLEGQSSSTEGGAHGLQTGPAAFNVEAKYIEPNYFATLGAHLLAGRDFTARDFRGRNYCASVGIVSEGAVKAYFSDTPPLSARMVGWFCDSATAVIGVASNMKTQSLAGTPEPAVYLSLDEVPIPRLTVLVRAKGDPVPLMAAARRVVAKLDPYVPVLQMETMRTTIERVATPQRLAARVVSGLAIAALLLAAIGLYGLIAQVVRERRREIGIRMALGATPRSVVVLVLWSVAGAVLSGLTIGVAVAVGGSRALTGLLYGITPTDASAYVVGCATLGVVAVVASWIPARRAAAIDPASVMREE